MTRLFFAQALLPTGWARDVAVEVAGDGTIASVGAGSEPTGAAARLAIGVPGLANLHSHAFQRGMAGLAEVAGSGPDSFWTWRQVMYRFLDRLTPDDVEAIAAGLYLEMLQAGFTAVAEFHYLHHGPDGRPYADPAEMAGRIAAAASATGIGLTLLPVLYAHGGFGGQPAQSQQRRFVSSPDLYGRLVAAAGRHLAGLPHARLGLAPHSLRAVTAEGLAEAVAAHGQGPIHIHVAEQMKEVEDCLAWSGRRPVDWLMDHQDVGPRWCLVHATHMTAEETARLARSGAVAGLCPQTEANLGDGIFPATGYLAAGGAIGIGTDSHIRVDVAEEVRTLEYGQRLRDRARNVLGEPGRSTGRRLYDAALAGGAQALGRPTGAIAPGQVADLVALDAEDRSLLGRTGDAALDGWLFTGDRSAVHSVWVAGRRVVEAGRPALPDGGRALRERFAETMRRIAAV